jgi:hypothetical protein
VFPFYPTVQGFFYGSANLLFDLICDRSGRSSAVGWMMTVTLIRADLSILSQTIFLSIFDQTPFPKTKRVRGLPLRKWAILIIICCIAKSNMGGQVAEPRSSRAGVFP